MSDDWLNCMYETLSFVTDASTASWSFSTLSIKRTDFKGLSNSLNFVNLSDYFLIFDAES